jgi:hypothetical protein
MQIGLAVLLGALAVQIVAQTLLARPHALREVSAVTCTQGSSQKVSLRSTERLPEASGVARVERMGGTTGIEVEVDSMKPASLFGGDYNTFVLWVVPPGGRAENVGEFTLDGSQAVVRATTPSTTFGILVTAEPHYLVGLPSAFVVLQSKGDRNSQTLQLPVVEGVYNFSRSTLANVQRAKGKVHSDVRQAFTAVRLAQRAGATSLAGKELSQAQDALQKTVGLWREHADRNQIAAQARETVRLAVAAQRLAQDRALQETRLEPEGLGGGRVEPVGRDARDGQNRWR